MPNQEETFDAREPPKLTLPSIPPDFVATSTSDLRGHRPMKAEVAAAELAVQEVTAMTDWESLFGITAPPASMFVTRVGRAVRWSALLAELLPLVAFVKSRTGDAWRDALEVTDDLKAPFHLASKANPARVEPLLGLRTLLRAQTNVAKRAVASRARNLLTKAKAPADLPLNPKDR